MIHICNIYNVYGTANNTLEVIQIADINKNYFKSQNNDFRWKV